VKPGEIFQYNQEIILPSMKYRIHVIPAKAGMTVACFSFFPVYRGEVLTENCSIPLLLWRSGAEKLNKPISGKSATNNGH
jgi:hypothetical protein